MQWYEAEVQALERARAAAPPSYGGVAFYGSSSIRLWHSLATDFPGIDVVNLGFGGSTLAACVWFFERLVVPVRPRTLILYAGDNDIGDGQNPEAVLRSFRQLLQKTRQHFGPIPFAFVSIKPSPARRALTERILQTNEMIRRELLAREASFYIDVFSLMLDSDKQPRPELFCEDGLHLNAAGYQLWSQIVGSYHEHLF